MNEGHHMLIQAISNPVFLLDEDSRLRDMNVAAERTLGYTIQELRGRVFADLCAPDELSKFLESIQRCFTGDLQEWNTKLVTKAGQCIELHFVGSPRSLVDATAVILAVAQEIYAANSSSQDGEARDAQNILVLLHNEMASRKLAEQQLQLLASELGMAENRERERIAGLLHDNLQQLLVGAKYRVQTLEKRDGLSQEAADLRTLIDDALETTRSLVTDLSPPALREGLLAALGWLADRMRQQLGFSVMLKIEDRVPIPKEVEAFAFHAVRELLLNAVKHSKSRSARVQVLMTEDALDLEVEDDGAGFDPTQLHTYSGKSGGFGLVSIRERAALLGGSMEIRSKPGSGSRFRLRLPRVPFLNC